MKKFFLVLSFMFCCSPVFGMNWFIQKWNEWFGAPEKKEVFRKGGPEFSFPDINRLKDHENSMSKLNELYDEVEQKIGDMLQEKSLAERAKRNLWELYKAEDRKISGIIAKKIAEAKVQYEAAVKSALAFEPAPEEELSEDVVPEEIDLFYTSWEEKYSIVSQLKKEKDNVDQFYNLILADLDHLEKSKVELTKKLAKKNIIEWGVRHREFIRSFAEVAKSFFGRDINTKRALNESRRLHFFVNDLYLGLREQTKVTELNDRYKKWILRLAQEEIKKFEKLFETRESQVEKILERRRSAQQLESYTGTGMQDVPADIKNMADDLTKLQNILHRAMDYYDVLKEKPFSVEEDPTQDLRKRLYEFKYNLKKNFPDIF